MATKSLPDAQNAAARDFVTRILDRDFPSSNPRSRWRVTEAAKAFGIAQATLSDFMAGNRGGGMKVLAGVAAYTGKSIDEVLGLTRPEPPVAPERVVELDSRYPNLDAAAQWARADGIPEDVIQRVRDEAHSMEEDPHPRLWLQRIDDEARRVRRENLGLAADEEREQRRAEADKARVAEMKKTTKPKLPRTRRNRER